MKEKRKEIEGFKRINKSIDYLEDNLCNDIKIKEVAELAGVSKFHIQKNSHDNRSDCS